MRPELETDLPSSEAPAGRPRNVLVQPAPGLLTSPDPPVVWAAERTALAWLRTGIALIAFGFVLARSPAMFAAVFAPGAGTLVLILAGVGLITAGVAATVIAVARHRTTLERLHRGETLTHSAAMAVVVGGAVAIAGALLAAYTFSQL